MYFQFKLLSIVFVNLFSIPFSMGTDVPSYNEVLAQQIKCNTLYFSNSLWDKKLPLLAKMQPSTYVVVSAPAITELPAKDNKNGRRRDFKVSAIRYSTFSYKPKEEVLPSLDKEGTYESLIHIMETKTGSGIFQIAAGEAGDIPGSNPDAFLDFFYEISGNTKWDGLYCVVLIDDFLKNANAIDINKLCAGKTIKDRETTKKSIEQTRKAWLAAGVGKLK